MIKKYYESLLDRNQNLGIQFSDGWVFGKVLTVEDMPYNFNRYDLLTTANGSSTIASGTADEWHELRDASNNRILWEDTADKMLHIFAGVYPPRLRLWYRYPDPIQRGGNAEIKISALSATTGGFKDGLESPYRCPTTATELIIPKDLVVKVGIFNPEVYGVHPRLFFYIRRMKLHYYNPKDSYELKIIDNIMNRKIPCKLWSPGIESFDYNTFSELNVYPIAWKNIDKTVASTVSGYMESD